MNPLIPRPEDAMMATEAVSAIGSQQFLQLLVAQLQNQDPLNPVSDKEFIAQLTALNTLESLNNLNVSFAQMLRLQQLTQGASLLGKTVEYVPPGGALTTGTVDAITVQNGQFVLTVGSTQVPLDQVQTVR
jgi:flagellar basal-body rod modification protein FlgD